jgi:SAM-dependent methyltransferase
VCLGEQPLPNALVDDATEPTRLPLHVSQCERCSAVQLTRQVPPLTLFDAYPYYSSQSQTMVRSAAALVDKLVPFVREVGGSAVEIGSNDGYLLQHYVEAGVPVLGIDPATGPAQVARERDVRTRCEFFDDETALDVGVAVIHANNVLAHVPNPRLVLEGVRRNLARDGLLIIETPWLAALLRGCQFDTIYHEHRWYWSLTALAPLLAAHGLEVRNVEVLPLHGGSLRIWAGHVSTDSAVVPGDVYEGERSIPWLLERFAEDVRYRVEMLRHWWSSLEATGDVAGYGAAAKGIMLCNALGVAPSFIVDSTPAKQGRFAPGIGVPIVHPVVLDERQPTHCVVFAWNFASEIAAKAQRYVDGGGALWVPMPAPARIEAEAHAVAS